MDWKFQTLSAFPAIELVAQLESRGCGGLIGPRDTQFMAVLRIGPWWAVWAKKQINDGLSTLKFFLLFSRLIASLDPD